MCPYDCIWVDSEREAGMTMLPTDCIWVENVNINHLVMRIPSHRSISVCKAETLSP